MTNTKNIIMMATPRRRVVSHYRWFLVVTALGMCVMGSIGHIEQLLASLPSTTPPLPPWNLTIYSSTTVNTADTTRKETFTASNLPGELYVPTMRYRFKPRNRIYLSSEPLLNCSATSIARTKDVEWTFFYPTSSKTGNTPQNTSSRDKESTKSSSFLRPRQVLIALTSGYDHYATMLTHTAHAALLYASRQNQLGQERQQQQQQQQELSDNTTATNLNVTVVVLQGMAFHPHDDVACAIPPMYASLNKIRLLFYAIDHSEEYDYLLLLDADALLVDWDYDFTQLLREHDDTHLLAAQPCRGTNAQSVQNDDDPSSEDEIQQQQRQATIINSGTTFWNLHHDQIKPVAISWFQESKNAALQGIYQGDQRYLQMALSSAALDNNATTTTSLVRPTLQEFNYRDGSVVQHFMQRGKIDTWKDRLDQLVNIYQQHLCKKYDCSQVPRKVFPTQ